MEFFGELRNSDIGPPELHQLLTIARLPQLCASIDEVLSVQSSQSGEIYCVWGQFRISREEIRNGVRFALLSCPHAFAWTITVHEHSRAVVIHCTMDKEEAEEDFLESIEQFVKDWEDGLKGKLGECA